jgi:hypothetical protein
MGQGDSTLTTGLEEAKAGTLSPSVEEEVRQELLDSISASLFFFCKYIMGFAELHETIHGVACDFVQDVLRTPNGLGLLEDPRGHFKSSIATIAGPLHLVISNVVKLTPYQGANTRIGIVSSKKEHACNFLRLIRWQLDNNALLRWLRPEIFPEAKDKAQNWSTKTITLRRTEGFTQPTFDTLGAESGAASKHYNVCFFDDLIHEKNYKSITEVENAIEIARLSRELTGIESGTRLFVGNSWDMFDLNNSYLKGEELRGIIKIFSRSGTACKRCYLGRPLTPEGALEEHVHEQPVFPLLPMKGHGGGPMTFADLESIKKQLGTRIYMAQLENETLDPSILDFSMEWLRYFTMEADEHGKRYIQYIKATPKIEGGVFGTSDGPRDFETVRIPLENLDVYELVDPGLSDKSEGARTAIVTVAAMRSGPSIFVLDPWAQAIDASKVTDMIIRKYKEWRPRKIGIEGVAYQRVLGPTIRRVAAAEYHININEDKVIMCKTGRQDKDERIRGALAPLFENRHVYIQRHHASFIDEYRKFPRGVYKDILDAFSFITQVWRNISHLSDEEKKRRRDRAKLRYMRRMHNADPVTKYPVGGWD